MGDDRKGPWRRWIARLSGWGASPGEGLVAGSSPAGPKKITKAGFERESANRVGLSSPINEQKNARVLSHPSDPQRGGIASPPAF